MTISPDQSAGSAPARIWNGAGLAALAYPRGDGDALASLLEAYLDKWRGDLSRRSGSGFAPAAAQFKRRHHDPIFMAWLHDSWRAGEARAMPEHADLTRLGDGRFVRVGARDCPQLLRMLREPERESSLPNEMIDKEVCAALSLIETVWPQAMIDIDRFARALFVLEMPKGHYPSGSDADLPFILKVTVAPGMWPALLADSIVHETAHVKLRIASRLGKFCDDDQAPKFHHPWRRDPRPLSAVLLAAHAFVSIFTFYAKMVNHYPNDAAARAEADRLRDEIAQVLPTLASASGLTPMGQRLSALLAEQYRRQAATLRI